MSPELKDLLENKVGAQISKESVRIEGCPMLYKNLHAILEVPLEDIPLYLAQMAPALEDVDCYKEWIPYVPYFSVGSSFGSAIRYLLAKRLEHNF